MKSSEIIGTGVLSVLMALAVMSGLGGGGIIVPLLMAFYGLDTKRSVAVSGFTIVMGSVFRFVFTYSQKHPSKDSTCIEYGLTNIMLPTVLMGSVSGVFFNILLPEIILQVCMFVLLFLLAINSGLKAIDIYKKESRERD